MLKTIIHYFLLGFGISWLLHVCATRHSGMTVFEGMVVFVLAAMSWYGLLRAVFDFDWTIAPEDEDQD